MRRIGLLFLATISILSVEAATVRSICTTTIVGDVVARIAGDAHEVTVLLPVDADPHAFERTPQDLVAIARADVVFPSGAGLEAGLEPFVESAPTIHLSDGLDLLQPVEPNEEAEHGDDHDHEGADPHVWFDPTYVMAWVDRIADALAKLDPEGAPAVQPRAVTYRAELEALDIWIAEEVVALYTGSLSALDGPAATYLDLMRFNVQAIVDALSLWESEPTAP
jgi:ABC-type Zn uptake system ZnuABC Zn-binding protein ZnuA